jgi:hypothetical protein
MGRRVGKGELRGESSISKKRGEEWLEFFGPFQNGTFSKIERVNSEIFPFQEPKRRPQKGSN